MIGIIYLLIPVFLWKTYKNIERMKVVPRGSRIFFSIYDVILMYIICKANIFSKYLTDFSDLIY